MGLLGFLIVPLSSLDKVMPFVGNKTQFVSSCGQLTGMAAWATQSFPLSGSEWPGQPQITNMGSWLCKASACHSRCSLNNEWLRVSDETRRLACISFCWKGQGGLEFHFLGYCRFFFKTTSVYIADNDEHKHKETLPKLCLQRGILLWKWHRPTHPCLWCQGICRELYMWFVSRPTSSSCPSSSFHHPSALVPLRPLLILDHWWDRKEMSPN